MRSKTLLVAQREYYENLRTKTFWIGILAVPVMLVLMVFVPRLLEKAKDVRRYAVIDQSGWLLDAIEERATFDDTWRLLTFLQDEAHEGAGSLERLPQALRSLAAMVKDASVEKLETLARRMTAAGASFMASGSGAEAALPEGVSEDALTEQRTEFLKWLATLGPEEARKLGAGIKKEQYVRIEVPESEQQPEEYLRSRLAGGSKDLFAYFVIGPDPMTGSEQNKYVSNNRTDDDLREWLGRLATREIVSRRFAAEGIDEDVARRIQREVTFEEKQISKSGEEQDVSTEDKIKQWAPVVFVYLLWISIFTAIQMLVTNTVEEKSNRIIEVLLSSVSSLQLMTGKVCGIAATGLTLVGSWVVFFLLALKFLPGMIGVDVDLDLSILVSEPVFLASFVVYFLLGYLLYAAVLAGLGSLCNSVKEAQNFMTPVMVLMVVPILAMVPVGKDPNGTLARILTYVPPFTPFTMMNRAAGPPAPWEYVVTTVLLLVSIALAFWGAAKIFRVGVLMTGKPPKIGEILRFLRTPVGAVPELREHR